MNQFFPKILFVLLPFLAFPQSKPWAEVKASIKSDSEKDKRMVVEYSQKHKLPISFSDGRNLMLMRAVHPSGKPIYLTTLNAEASTTSGASLIQSGATGFSLNASGQHIFQWEAGLVKPHIEFGDRVVANEGTAEHNHATHVAGILMASGVNAQAKGMSPNAKLHSYYFDDDISELAAQAESNPYGFLITNHSYGVSTGWNKSGNNWSWNGDPLISSDEDFTAGFYSVRTRQIDQVAFLSPYATIVWAAGNDRADVGTGGHPPDCNGGTGYDCIIQDGTAKNIITVGAVNKVTNYTSPSSVVMSSFSSWGPTDDGRIKPDLVGAGVNLFSTSSSGVDGYTSLSGTSMATPNVSGSLLLLQDLFGKLNGGQWMKASTLKALAIHTAKEAGSATGPDYSFGWGLIDVAHAAKLIGHRDNENVFIEEGLLANSENHEWILRPQLNKKIMVTLVWTDPAGLSPVAALDPPFANLINDLDIRLVDESGSKNYPWILDPGSPTSAATRGDNTRDNVEKLEFDFPQSKPYRLKISHKGYLVNNSQSYSLIISYTSQSTSKTFYWIGGAGEWSDPSHWSATSGGNFIGTVPGQQDHVIVDENSFNAHGDIRLTSDVKCKSFKWWLTKPTAINFNGHSIEVRKELTIASNSFQKMGAGKFKLNSLDSGVLNFANSNTRSPHIEFVSGQWTMRGNIFVDSLVITGGQVELNQSNLTVNHFVGQSTATAFSATQSLIKIGKTWKIDASKINISAMTSTLSIESDTVTFQVNDFKWTGALAISNSLVSMNGAFEFDSLSLTKASSVAMTTGSSIRLKNGFAAIGEEGKEINIFGSSPSTLHFDFHQKLCFDFLKIANVNLVGDAIVTVGSNSTIQNSTGWRQQKCDEVLFPDFEIQYNCQNALTSFTNNSTGPIETYHWDFGDPSSDQNESDLENPFHQFEATGSYIVALTVSDGVETTIYQEEISIVENFLPEPEIEFNSEMMFSSVEAERYQWFNSDGPILNETDRMFSHLGVESWYQLAIFEGLCNRPSAPLVISGLKEDFSEPFYVFPNPASDKVYFNVPNVDDLFVLDCLGRRHTIEWHHSDQWADLSFLEEGVYMMVVEREGKRLARRVMVKS